jgi:hypothetical protein
MHVSLSFNPRRAATVDDLVSLQRYLERKRKTSVLWYVLSVEHVEQGDKAHLQCAWETTQKEIRNVSADLCRQMGYGRKPETLCKEWKPNPERNEGPQFLQGYCLKELDLLDGIPWNCRTTLSLDELTSAQGFYLSNNEAIVGVHERLPTDHYQMMETWLVVNLDQVWNRRLLIYIRDVDILEYDHLVESPWVRPLISCQRALTLLTAERGTGAIPRHSTRNMELCWHGMCLHAIQVWLQLPEDHEYYGLFSSR